MHPPLPLVVGVVVGVVVWGCFRGLLGVWRCFLVAFVFVLLLNSYCSATGLLDWAWGLFWWFSLEGIIVVDGIGDETGDISTGRTFESHWHRFFYSTLMLIWLKACAWQG